MGRQEDHILALHRRITELTLERNRLVDIDIVRLTRQRDELARTIKEILAIIEKRKQYH